MAFMALVFGLSLSSGVFAKATPGTWTGTLIDGHCGQKHAAQADKLKEHDKDCTMKCAKGGKGLGLAVDGKWYSFDAKGEKTAWKLLKAHKGDANLQVTVVGKVDGEKITISKISDKG